MSERVSAKKWETAEVKMWRGAVQMHQLRAQECQRMAALTRDHEVKSALLNLARVSVRQSRRNQGYITDAQYAHPYADISE